jgi:hypothetical protein
MQIQKVLITEDEGIIALDMTLKKSKNYFENIVGFQKENKFFVLFLSSSFNLKEYGEKCNSNYFYFLQKPF